METPTPTQVWLLVAAIAGVAFMLGRASAGGAGPDRAERRLRERQTGAEAYGALSSSNQAEIDRLILDGKTIDAIKRVREETGMGLKESKDAIDVRRQALKGA